MEKTVLVTGASRGIGYAIARGFCATGCNVIINFNKSREPAEALAAEFSAHAMAVQADVSNGDQVLLMFAAAAERFGGVDVVVNNAAVAAWELFDKTDESTFDRLFGVNVKGVFNVCKAAVPQMIAQKSGRIINISSVWGVVGASCEVVYSASKAAVIGFSKALAKELGPSNITVNCVAPGVINTDMNVWLGGDLKQALAQNTPLGRLGSPADVVGLVCFLASAEAGFITGQVICVDGGFML
ncbi:MAG: 3-oxoacyl-ACP reductase FabG [Oscillospiraceae bacterium]|nr:3-oxoacyl-ACP reductase FabG [Oscillospiraceae bacterium]